MTTAINQLLKRKQIYIQELAKLTEASESEMSDLNALTQARLEEILKFDRFNARLDVCNFCLNLLREVE